MKARSVTRRKSRLTVAPSPLNGVKLELGVLLAVGLCLWFVHERVAGDALWQLVLLFGYGAGAALWVVLRARRVSRAVAAEQHPAGRRDT